MARWRCGLQGCVEYKVREMPEKKSKKKNIQCRVQGCVEYKVTHIKNKLNRRIVTL